MFRVSVVYRITVRAVVPDEASDIEYTLRTWCDQTQHPHLIVTTGGTGFSVTSAQRTHTHTHTHTDRPLQLQRRTSIFLFCVDSLLWFVSVGVRLSVSARCVVVVVSLVISLPSVSVESLIVKPRALFGR
jgi:hypothetical protein